MAIVEFIDGSTRRIHLNPFVAIDGVLTLHTVEDIYKEYRGIRRSDEQLRKFKPLLRAEGMVAKGGGKFTPRYIVLIDGTKIMVPDVDKLVVKGEVLTDDQTEPFDVSDILSPVIISYEPSEAEVIEVQTGGLSTEQSIWLSAIKAVTDQFLFTVAGKVDSNAKSINNETILGNGSSIPFHV